MEVATDRRTLRLRSGRRVGLARLTRRCPPNTRVRRIRRTPRHEVAAGPQAKQDSAASRCERADQRGSGIHGGETVVEGRGTTEFENHLATPRRQRSVYSLASARPMMFATIHMQKICVPDVNSASTPILGIFSLSSCHRQWPARELIPSREPLLAGFLKQLTQVATFLVGS